MIAGFIGLGANLGDAAASVRAAFDALDMIAGVRVTLRSRLYMSKPVGYVDQPAFVNAVCAIQTLLAPEQLLAAMHSIERRCGRVRSFANAPRTLDLDLLVYGEVITQSALLTLPHPRMHERGFVLFPLAEIAPQARIPGHGAVAALVATLATDQAADTSPLPT